jgi:hypothetical protein
MSVEEGREEAAQESTARQLFDQRAFDWLDEMLRVSTGTKGGV